VEYLFLALILLGIPFVLPIVAWVSARRARTNVEALAQIVDQQQTEINQLKARLTALSKETAARVAPDVPAAAPAPAAAAPPRATPAPVAPPPTVATPPTPVATPAPPVPPVPVAPAPPVVATPKPVAPLAPSKVEGPVPAAPAKPTVPAMAPAAPPTVSAPAAAATVQRPPAVPPLPPPPPPPSAPASSGGFDWESLVGVKLFSAIAGIALVFAAVFFLRYSIEAGWLQPPVRVAIGVVVAIALLIVCELKAARRYPATANAMDAAAIAILFATFFAAHALWNLIPAMVTFGLLGIVTVIAVLLSIRRESLFIAVLGLLGGFATPALLSTGENRPIPLFAYLLLLNIGLAWVGYSRGWTVLTWLTLVFTAFYQWGWVFKFLDASSLPLAMSVFLIFPVAAVLSLALRGHAIARPDTRNQFEQSALISAVLPGLFAVYLALTPAYGAQATLLFGFLLLIDLGLLAVAIGLRQEPVHAAGAVTTMVVMVVWLAQSYSRSGATTEAIAFTSVFVLVYLAAPLVAAWFQRPFTGPALSAPYVAPFLLVVFPVVAGLEPELAAPWPLAGALVVLIVLIAWRAMVSRVGALYYIAAFFAVATQAVWSATHLTLERLPTAVALYSLFGLVSLSVPLIARRLERPLLPAWGSGVVLLVSLGLLMFLAAGSVAPAALWALGLLLAILNAGLFIESAAGRLPLMSQVGSLFSWLILMTWWVRAAGSVGVLPSLTVVVGLSLITLAGHAWSHRSAGAALAATSPSRFSHGLYLGLMGQLFLILLVTNRAWGVPPWPIFGALFVMTLATTATALWTRATSLHTAGCIAAALVMASWSASAGSDVWGLTAVLASMAVSAYALAWIPFASRFGSADQAAPAACTVLYIGELSLILAAGAGAMPPFPVLVAAHVINLAIILALTARYDWSYVAIGAALPVWMAISQWQARVTFLDEPWSRLLILTGALYAVFAIYPFVRARSAPDDRDPYLAAIAASAIAFFGARTAFIAGQLDWMIGAIPVVLGAVLAAMLRMLLTLEPVGRRDLGRLALVAGAALAFVTVAIPLQLERQWITIGWALEGAALAWLYRRIPHRGLFYSAMALLGAVFVRLAMNPDVLEYAPRSEVRIFNWYLYTYLICAIALLVAAWWLNRTNDRLLGSLRLTPLLSAGGVILLFFLLNIEIADFYATGPRIAFRFGVTVSQDLTYTIGWLVFGMLLLAAGIWLAHRSARIAAVTLIALTTFKCFLYDLSSLEGLYRVASFVGLAISLALVSLALQKFVLSKPERLA
jgi:uncharacterized membrane protein